MPKKKLQNLGEGDLQAIGDLMGGLLDRQSAVFTKDLNEVKSELKAEITQSEEHIKKYVNQGVAAVMDGVDGVASTLAEKDRVENLERWASMAGTKIGFKTQIKN